MEMTLEKKNNQEIIEMIPSSTLQEHLKESNVEFTASEQLTLINLSMKSLHEKEMEYMKYAMDYRTKIHKKALMYLGEISLVKKVIANEDKLYTFEVLLKDEVYSMVNKFEDIKPLVKKMMKSNTELVTYKINVIDENEELVVQLWINRVFEIIMYSFEHMEVNATGIDLEALPFTHLQTVHFIKEMNDNSNYIYIDMETEGINRDGLYDAVAIIPEQIFKNKMARSEMLGSIQYVSNLVIE